MRAFMRVEDAKGRRPAGLEYFLHKPKIGIHGAPPASSRLALLYAHVKWNVAEVVVLLVASRYLKHNR
jgi:hypothetical protein